LTFPIFQNLIKGAIFYDAGNVWTDTSDFMKSGDYAHGTGIGVRVKTPIGPVKLDWGYPLSEIDEEEQKGRFYFSMSHGF
ncbi:MAG: BamA/TamA family outer membrane protein, partial [Candidatus Omnitrophota bacterium]